MAWISFNDLARHGSMRGQSGRIDKAIAQDVIRITMHKNNKSKSEILIFYIGMNICKKARFINGDLMEILWDPDAVTGMIRRVKGFGYSLTVPGGNGKASSKLGMTWRHGMIRPNGCVVAEQIVLKDEGILFSLPTGSFSYDKD
jgi:hypothetical protein